MSRVFRTTRSDPRRLSMLEHQRATQTPGERLRIHGPIRPMPASARPEPFEGRIHGPIRPMPAEPPRGPMTRLDALIVVAGIATSAFTVVYFALQLLRPLLP